MRFLVALADGLNKLRDLPPLLFRLALAYGFFIPFWSKIQNLNQFIDWLASRHYPAPVVSAWIVMILEGLGALSLFFGFATRIFSFLLGIIMVVAITEVHWEHGFSSNEGGFEIPLYYLLILFSLFITGPGKISIDGLIARPYRIKPRHP